MGTQSTWGVAPKPLPSEDSGKISVSKA